MNGIPDINQWLRQAKRLNKFMEHFQEKPTKERQEALISEIEAYAHIAETGAMEIPKGYRNFP
jgi:hypothetical protein